MQRKILILDDNEDLLIPCRMILERAGYLVETRMLCNDVIKDVIDVAPDIILLDLNIFPIGGDLALRLLKENPSTRNIPVLLFSAATGLEVIAREYYADGFIQKPFDTKTLLEKIGQKEGVTNV